MIKDREKLKYRIADIIHEGSWTYSIAHQKMMPSSLEIAERILKEVEEEER
jgi:hypothetical protein